MPFKYSAPGFLYTRSTMKHPPLLILVLGLPGSGKSYFSKHLAHELNAYYFSSDRTREEMKLMGHYDEESKQEVYDRLEERAREVLKKGKNVLIDATFHKKKRREQFTNLARQCGARLKMICITADESLIRERLKKERKESEADFAVYQTLKKEFEPIESSHLSLHSRKNNLAEMLRRAKDYLLAEKA